MQHNWFSKKVKYLCVFIIIFVLNRVRNYRVCSHLILSNTYSRPFFFRSLVQSPISPLVLTYFISIWTQMCYSNFPLTLSFSICPNHFSREYILETFLLNFLHNYLIYLFFSSLSFSKTIHRRYMSPTSLIHHQGHNLSPKAYLAPTLTHSVRPAHKWALRP